jgi:hypothetical protein
MVRGGGLGGLHRNAIADDCSHLPAHQIGRQAWQLIQLIVRKAILDRDVLAFNKPGLAQALDEMLSRDG